MAKRVCLLTGNETNCTDSCYLCGCGGEVALNNCYVPIYNIQRVCDIVKNMADVSGENEEIAEYIRNELEKMTVSIENKAADVQTVKRGMWIDIYEWAKMHDSIPSGMCLYYWCSECQEEQEKKSNFCPNCGARMDGGTE